VTVWAEHVTAALLGTRRRPAPPLPEAPAGTGESAARLLDQAALLTVRRRAGRLPGTAEPIAPAPPETARIVPPGAARRLRQILGGERIRALPEWLEHAAANGYRVPPGLLPELLERGRADRAIRPFIARAAGRRGVWLALQNTDWAYLVAESGADAGTGPETWETGTRAQRVARLRWLRDTDPAAAVTVLRSTWAREPAPDRALFLGIFERGLALGDEEFLEAALDDRGQDVRRIAADLLAGLPGSAYGRRMAERARDCLRAEDRTVRLRTQQWIIIDPPSAHDDAMQRDGIPFHAAERIGNRAGWLREILARTPLSTWTELFGVRPMEVVCLPIADGHDTHSAKDVHLGWARAALRQRDADWARALLKGGVVLDEIEALTDLLAALPAAEQGGAAADLIRWVEGGPELLRALDRIPGPWTGELADAVIGILTAVAGRGPGRPADLDERDVAQLCRLAGERLTPGAAPRLDALAREQPESRPLTELAILRFRHDMLEELR
jgi:hypothetical protein